MYITRQQFSVPQGITCVIGSGGKTTFLRYLADRLPGNILLTTSTHIQPFAGIPLVESGPEDTAASLQVRLEQALQNSRVLCLGRPLTAGPGADSGPAPDFAHEFEPGYARKSAQETTQEYISASAQELIRKSTQESTRENMQGPHPIGKLGPAPVDPGAFLPLFDYILIEADGSRHHPLKAHRSFEPVIPPQTALTVCLAGLSGLGQPAQTACHCTDLFCRIAGSNPAEPVQPAHIARVLNEEDLADIYLLNQTDVLPDPAIALELCSYIKKPTLAGSLQKQKFL